MADAQPVDPTFALVDRAAPGASGADRLAGAATLAFALAILAGLVIVGLRNPPVNSLDVSTIEALYGP